MYLQLKFVTENIVKLERLAFCKSNSIKALQPNWPLCRKGVRSKPCSGNDTYWLILELNMYSWRNRLRCMMSTSGKCTTLEYLTPLRSLPHFSHEYMLSPLSSSALKKAARQWCSDTAGPHNHDRSHTHIHHSHLRGHTAHEGMVIDVRRVYNKWLCHWEELKWRAKQNNKSFER